MRRSVRRHFVAVLVVMFTAAVALPALAGGSVVTRGDFAPFPAGDGDIGGHAQMVRRANGTTKVSIHVTGLDPDATYVSHVHNQACDDGQAGGHFRQDPFGAIFPPNEIWPGDGEFAPNRAGVANERATVDYFANSDAVSVVLHVRANGTSPKVACADLS